jgi:DinB superfamily
MEFGLDHGLAVLERTPSVLRVLLAGLPDVWTRQNEGPETWSPREVVDTFANMRAENLSTLRAWQLTPAQLELTGIHPEFGSVTLKQHLSTWVAHDLGHLLQITQTMARQYRDAVGPWRAYLSALR